MNGVRGKWERQDTNPTHWGEQALGIPKKQVLTLFCHLLAAWPWVSLSFLYIKWYICILPDWFCVKEIFHVQTLWWLLHINKYSIISIKMALSSKYIKWLLNSPNCQTCKWHVRILTKAQKCPIPIFHGYHKGSWKNSSQPNFPAAR